jgi:hypothetical protein
MNDYLSREKVLRIAQDRNATLTIRDIKEGKADPDPITLGDGSTSGVGDVVAETNTGDVYEIKAIWVSPSEAPDRVWAYGGNDRFTTWTTFRANELQVLPKPDTWEMLEKDFSEAIMSGEVTGLFAGEVIRRAKALAGVESCN